MHDQVIGGAAALMAGGNGADVNQGAATAQSAAINNYLTHANYKQMIAELDACNAKASGCSDKEQRTIANKWTAISRMNDAELLQMCTDEACVDAKLLDMVRFDDVWQNMVRDPKYSAAAIALRTESAFFVSKAVATKIEHNIAFREEFESYKNAHKEDTCIDASSQACVNAFTQKWESTQSKLETAEKARLYLAMAMTGGAIGLAFGARAVQIVSSCAADPFCTARFGIFLGDVAAGDALGGGQLSMTIATGGRLVLKKGDEIIALVDDALGTLPKVDGQAVPTFRAANGSVYTITDTSGTLAQKTWTVDPRFKAADQAAGVLVNDSYIKNPTARNLADSVTASGKIRVDGQLANGQYMYVVDTSGNIVIGTRGGQRMPHPTLIGGSNPQVQAAGIVDIRGGMIYSVNNASGHFKPGVGSRQNAEGAFGSLPSTSFHGELQGYNRFYG